MHINNLYHSFPFYSLFWRMRSQRSTKWKITRESLGAEIDEDDDD